MALHCLFFLLVSFLIVHENYSEICSKRKSVNTLRGTQYVVQYFCCNNAIYSNGKCVTCPRGYITDEKADTCVSCMKNQYGQNCGYVCDCSRNKRCDNVHGCVARPVEEITTARGEHYMNPNNERIIYIGCSGLLAIVVIILIAILCYKKTRRITLLDNRETKKNNQSGAEEANVVKWKSNKNNIDENEYDEIDESMLCDIKTTSQEIIIMDTDEDDDDENQSIKADAEGYLNTYQPIISTEVDIHQYSSTKKDKKVNPTTSDEHQGDSDYLHLYQSLTKNTSDTKHEYTRLENLDTDIPEIGMERKTSIEMSAQ